MAIDSIFKFKFGLNAKFEFIFPQDLSVWRHKMGGERSRTGRMSYGEEDNP